MIIPPGLERVKSHIKGSGLEISLSVYCCPRYHLADGRIVNLQIVRNLLQGIPVTRMSSMDPYVALGLSLLSTEYFIKARPGERGTSLSSQELGICSIISLGRNGCPRSNLCQL